MLTTNNRKTYFNKTFPSKLRELFATTNNLYGSTITDIKLFMMLQKKKVDANNKNKKKDKD